MMTFIDDHMSVILNQGGNGIVFLVNQTLIGRDINNAGRLFLPTPYDTDLRFR